jgi:guanylate kinase
MKNNKFLITITGPSTSGKSTLATLLKEEGFTEIVSTTTRPQRTGEIEGVNYYFTDEEKFINQLANQEFIEHVKVGKYFYGVSKKAISDVIDKEIPAVLVIEPNGANKVAEYCKEKGILIHKVFINNNIEILIERLKKRFYEDKNAKLDVYQERLWNIAIIEPKEWTQKAYSGEHYYDQIFNSFLPENQYDVKASILFNLEQKLNKQNKIKL